MQLLVILQHFMITSAKLLYVYVYGINSHCEYLQSVNTISFELHNKLANTFKVCVFFIVEKQYYIQNSISHSIYSDINECMEGSVQCMVHSQCVNTAGSYMCICDNGFILSSDQGSCCKFNSIS